MACVDDSKAGHRLLRQACLILSLAIAVTTAGQGQVSPTVTPIDWSADDSARVAFLTQHGRLYAARDSTVVILAPPDSLERVWLNRFADSLAQGVAEIRHLIGAPHSWQRIGSRPIRFYLSPGLFVSHADGRGGIFISLARVRDRRAPFLHEASHELLAPAPPFLPYEYPDSVAWERAAGVFPFWLNEGLADYLAQRAADATGFLEGDVFAVGGLARADSVCDARLRASSRRKEIQERIGRSGRLEALFTTDRAAVAPVYYACAQSFAAYIVARVNLPVVVDLFPRIPDGTWQRAIEVAAGAPLEELRRSWLDRISGSPAATRR